MKYEGIVFKQRYKSVNLKSSTKVLNKKHLIYIATRKGAIYNYGCNYGLFGKIGEMEEAGDIEYFDTAQKIIFNVSERATVYRAVLTLGHNEALEKGFYERAKWEELLKEKIGVIAKEMDIAEEDFRWAASFHYAKGHPHCHIMYYDNSAKVRNEFVSSKRFEIIAEKVRSGFNREIFKEEIRAEQKGKKESLSDLRLELLSVFKDLNIKEPLNLDRISNKKLQDIGGKLLKLTEVFPTEGSLRYAYLNRSTKEMINSFCDEILGMNVFSGMFKKYLNSVEAISVYYGNGEKSIEYQKDKAMKDLYTQLGNEILKFAKANDLIHPADPAGVVLFKDEIIQDITLHLKLNLQDNERYKELQAFFPKTRTKISSIITPEFNEKMHTLISSILADENISEKLNRFTALGMKLHSQITDEPIEEKEYYSPIYRDTRAIIMDSLYADAGYDTQYKQALAAEMLIILFGEISQNANLNRSKAEHRQRTRGSLSKTAKREIKVELSKSGDWEQGL